MKFIKKSCAKRMKIASKKIFFCSSKRRSCGRHNLRQIKFKKYIKSTI